MGCGSSKIPPDPLLIGLWISSHDHDENTTTPIDDEAKDIVLYNFDLVTRRTKYKYSNYYSTPRFRSMVLETTSTAAASVMEIEPDGYVRYIELDQNTSTGKVHARNVYSGPITDWGTHNGNGNGNVVWKGCCADSCCCSSQDGCMSFDVENGGTVDGETGILIVNGKRMHKTTRRHK